MKKETSSNGLGLVTTVFIVFLVLKLTGYITWGWFWVIAPLWMIPLTQIVIGSVLLATAAYLTKNK
jgi:hypothetical protein